MSKEWLIRTRDNKILGPVSKKKIQDFLDKKILLPDDEICKGNTDWIWIRERDLLDKLLGNSEDSDSQVVPSNEDLEFPDEE